MSEDIERRTGGPRVPLHTLVEIGAGEGGSAAFEAEAVNVTTRGMQLKTAYLPEVGEPLVCRFEAGGTEVIAQGQVAWRVEESFGGDFGVHFLDMDQESFEALTEISGDMVHVAEDGEELEDSSAPQLTRGSRVRLHIDGLGSPMKARVREGTRSDVMIGSNLEFLRVGQAVDLENVDGDANRPARIERVTVEVDPKSLVPQLVVTLRYLDIAEADEPSPHVQEETESVPSDMEYDDEEEDQEEEIECEQGPTVWDRVKKVGPKLAVVGSVTKSWSGKVAGAVGGAVSAATTKAVDKARERKQNNAPRRTTAPPPKGAFRSDGTRKRAVKQAEQEPDVPVRKAWKPTPKQAAMIGLAAVLLLLVGVVFARGSFSKSEETAKVEDSAGEVALAADGEGTEDPPMVPGEMGTDVGSDLVAKVPLFGSLPMTTSAPMAPMAAVAVPAVAAVTPPPGDTEEMEQDTETEEGETVASVDDDAVEEEEAKPVAKATKKTASKPVENKTFSRGRVSNPVVLNLKMNRAIKSIQGKAQSDGFVIDVMGARSAEPAAGFRKYDTRIATSRVVNNGSNAQLTVRFKGAVPNYRIQANGSSLRILIDGDKKTAAKPASRGKKPR